MNGPIQTISAGHALRYAGGIWMTYGTLQTAMEYADRGCIDEWLQLFLRGDGDNVALADGLLLEPRHNWGPVEIELEQLDSIRVNDGRHRLEMYRQLGVSKAWAVCRRICETAGEA